MKSTRTVATFGALAVVLLSGCAGERGAASPSATSTPSTKLASLTPTVVGGRAGVPDEAKKHTRAGAESYLRYYFDMVNVAAKTADPSVLDGLGGDPCEFCESLRRTFQSMKDNGVRSVDDVVAVREVGPHGDPPENEEYFTVHLVQFGTKVVNAEGKEVARDPKSDRTLYGRTVWRHGEWYFTGVQRNP